MPVHKCLYYSVYYVIIIIIFPHSVNGRYKRNETVSFSPENVFM